MTNSAPSLFETRPPSTLAQSAFVSLYGWVYEHSPWVAHQLYERGITDALDTPAALADAMAAVVNGAVDADKLSLLRAHPDLAGKLALADLTTSSQNEQKGAGLDQCSPDELARFRELNDAYKQKFGFPFIFAVKGFDRADILAAFERRVKNDVQAEFHEAIGQVHRIAKLRLEDL
ncbi:2-oxo-4-hydroxy-4-carboxy-5-ureidoimidazoline decarboxylase [Thalassospira lucentensis]|uniref:2-oxo-4-hydroxy-4-carboxy-5-ureidoimidazoline decarboxylase n=1 Tax=Thalassospira lucentensis TaxID=168935 RepID=UPI00142DCF98|nr:2-oxo-4-hydroxy-4-carboxy-5-ureidoimidazoline decarboxylase [Thalassospira lucentensis]NIZ00448.1 2-oxo-4-hydroxy-4-carboxy-5-ureidoimidazoline decarboxylase [Thalassospira lucentensis]